jgi:hypothetical protein
LRGVAFSYDEGLKDTDSIKKMREEVLNYAKSTPKFIRTGFGFG